MFMNPEQMHRVGESIQKKNSEKVSTFHYLKVNFENHFFLTLRIVSYLL